MGAAKNAQLLNAVCAAIMRLLAILLCFNFDPASLFYFHAFRYDTDSTSSLLFGWP